MDQVVRTADRYMVHMWCKSNKPKAASLMSSTPRQARSKSETQQPTTSDFQMINVKTLMVSDETPNWRRSNLIRQSNKCWNEQLSPSALGQVSIFWFGRPPDRASKNWEIGYRSVITFLKICKRILFSVPNYNNNWSNCCSKTITITKLIVYDVNWWYKFYERSPFCYKIK